MKIAYSWIQAGKSIRLGQILESETGKGVIVAMDHGITRPRSGIANIDETIRKVLAGKPDGLMINLGIVKRYFKHFIGKKSPGLILRIDGRRKPLFPIEDAIRCGASAVTAWLVQGLGEEAEKYHLEYLSKYVHDSEKLGMPLIMEPITFERRPNGELVEKREIESLKAACRLASELGTDLIKAPYVEDMKEVVKWSTVPILVLGGLKMETELDVLTIVRKAIDTGCIGCIIGRNVWQHKDPAGMVKAIKKVIHENVSPEEALITVQQ